MAGIVHFSSYFKYVEEAEHALWRAAGLSISAPGAAIGWPRVHASLDYHAPLRFEEEFDVVVAIAAMTDKTIRYRFLLSREGTRIASGAMTIVCVRKTPKPMRAVSIPTEISRRFRVSPLPPS
jgi:YbgC/YbaW family acyl-CoA thioester hydrolase